MGVHWPGEEGARRQPERDIFIEVGGEFSEEREVGEGDQ